MKNRYEDVDALVGSALDDMSRRIRDRDLLIASIVRHFGGDVTIPRKDLIEADIEYSECVEDGAIRLRTKG